MLSYCDTLKNSIKQSEPQLHPSLNGCESEHEPSDRRQAEWRHEPNDAIARASCLPNEALP